MKIIKLFRWPFKAFRYLLWKCSPLVRSDVLYIRLNYFLSLYKRLDLKNPITFNEKLQWLKLYNRQDSYIQMVDKYEAKQFIESKIGPGNTIDTIGVWDHFDQIDFDTLPSQFVLKCTHDCGGLVICKDKSSLDISKARKKIERCLSKNYYNYSREYPYKFVRPRILAEKYVEDNSGELRDYKFFCFDGSPKMMFVASGRSKGPSETRFDFYDMNFNHLPLVNGHPNAPWPIERPSGFDRMKEIASVLSSGIPHVRVDFYEVNGKVYVGELTFFHWGGLVPFEPDDWDRVLGSYIVLPEQQKGR